MYPDHELARWFDPLSLSLDEGDTVLRVSFPHSFFASWFMSSLKQDFERQTKIISKDLRIIYEGFPKAAGNRSSRPSPQDHKPFARALLAPMAEPAAGRNDALNERHTFANFLVNRKNDFPLAAAKRAVEEALAPAFTPIVFYGKSGSGKTHLLGAMANALYDKGIACYYGGIEFFSQMTNVADTPFRAVILDDAHRVCANPAVQDTMSALVDMYKTSGLLLVLAFDKPVASCLNLDQKLRFRLESALVIEVKRPDLEVRRQYVQRENEQLGLQLPKDQVLALAQRCQDIRSIDGALTRLLAFRSLVGSAEKINPTLPPAGDILNKTIGVPSVTATDIVNTVGAHFSVPPDKILSKNRDSAFVLPRQVAMFLCRELTSLSLPRIGRFFGGRDHTSVLYSVKKIQELQKSNKDMHNKMEELRAMCLIRYS